MRIVASQHWQAVLPSRVVESLLTRLPAPVPAGPSAVLNSCWRERAFCEGIMTKAQVEKRRAELLAQVSEFVKKEGR